MWFPVPVLPLSSHVTLGKALTCLCLQQEGSFVGFYDGFSLYNRVPNPWTVDRSGKDPGKQCFYTARLAPGNLDEAIAHTQWSRNARIDIAVGRIRNQSTQKGGHGKVDILHKAYYFLQVGTQKTPFADAVRMHWWESFQHYQEAQ